MSEVGKYLFRAANVWWRCAQYFVIASCLNCEACSCRSRVHQNLAINNIYSAYESFHPTIVNCRFLVSCMNILYSSK